MIQTIVLGPLTFHLYGLILGIAIVVGWWLTSRWVRKAGVIESDYEHLFWYVVVGGIMGARLYHVVDYWWYYQNHLTETVALWKGGLGIWGAVMGGTIGLLSSKFKGQSSNKNQRYIMLDAAACALPLSQAIGRWGNFVNNELFGKPTQVPWKLFIPEANRPTDYATFAYYHPLFLYESILNLLLFLFFRYMAKGRWKVGSGKFLGGYLVGYGCIRILLEPLRIDAWRLGDMYAAQWFGLAAIVTGLIVIKTRISKLE